LKNFKPEMTRPHDSDLRESGQIEQDADAVIFINRPIVILDKLQPTDGDTHDWDHLCNNWRKKAEVIVYFNRNGETGTVNFLFEGGTSRWCEDPTQKYFSASFACAPLNFVPRKGAEMAKAADFKASSSPSTSARTLSLRRASSRRTAPSAHSRKTSSSTCRAAPRTGRRTSVPLLTISASGATGRAPCS
jgi:hypothetical protein